MNVKPPLKWFVGKQIKDVADAIDALAKRRGWNVNVIDPDFNVSNIDYNPMRLNVHTDAQSVVTGFVFG